MKTTAQILWDAADLIEEKGHAKGLLIAPGGQLCARGAIAAANVGYEGFRTEPWLFSNYGWDLQARLADGVLGELVDDDVPCWNNAEERTPEEVITALRAAALSLDPSLANIGEPVKEVEVTPIQVPVVEPEPTPTPVKEPDRELQPV